MEHYKALIKQIGAPNRIKQTLSRKGQSIKNWRSKYFALLRKSNKKHIESLERRCNKFKTNLTKVKKSTRNSNDYQRRKDSDEKKNSDAMVDGMKFLIQQNKLEKEKNTDLQNVVETQTERITELTQESIPTKKNRKEYTPRMRNSSMILKCYGMSERNASKALKEVVEEMSQTKLDGPMPTM